MRKTEQQISNPIPGTVKRFPERTGGYVNYLYDSQKLRELRDNIPGYACENHLHTEKEAEQMLEDADAFIQKFFPWMKDFVIFQFSDGTVRLDAADRAFLDGE